MERAKHPIRRCAVYTRKSSVWRQLFLPVALTHYFRYPGEAGCLT